MVDVGVGDHITVDPALYTLHPESNPQPQIKSQILKWHYAS